MEREFLNRFLEKLGTDEELFSSFYAAAQGGTNKAFYRTVQESLVLDDSWIFTIEGVLPSIENIVRNPRKFIKEDDSIVDVERARRTTAKTVRHLASHTRNIRNITGDEVIPRKVLTTELNEDVCIYENRFVGALIHRLISFVERRKEAIDGHVNMFENTALNMTSAFKFGGAQMRYKLELEVKEPPRDEEYARRLRELLEKVDYIARRLRVLLGSDFMREIDKSKPVRPPIQKTNMIRMQTDYRNCYQLWMFVSSFSTLGYSIEVQDKTLPVETDYYDDLTLITAMSLQAMLANGLLNREKYDAIEYSAPQRKEMKNMTKVEFDADFRYDKTSADSDVVNEYYYQQMKQAFKRESKRPVTDDPALEEKELKMSFMRYFKAVSKINNYMYLDLIRQQGPQEVGRTRVQKRKADLDRQKMLVKRMRQLTKLKADDLEAQSKQEQRELARLAKCEEALRKEQTREARELYRKEKEKEAKQKAKEKARAKREQEALQQKLEAQARKENKRIAAAAVKAQKKIDEREQAKAAKLAAKEKEKEAVARQKAKEKLAKQKAAEAAAAKIKAQKQREKEKLARQKAAQAAEAKVKAQKEREKAHRKKAAEAAEAKVKAQKEREKARARAAKAKAAGQTAAKAKPIASAPEADETAAAVDTSAEE